MPYINIYAYSGRTEEVKKKTAQAIVKAASEAIGAPQTAFTVFFNDVDKENWDAQIEPIFEPLKDKMLIEDGELV